jgi:hypothetical protein
VTLFENKNFIFYYGEIGYRLISYLSKILPNTHLFNSDNWKRLDRDGKTTFFGYAKDFHQIINIIELSRETGQRHFIFIQKFHFDYLEKFNYLFGKEDGSKVCWIFGAPTRRESYSVFEKDFIYGKPFFCKASTIYDDYTEIYLSSGDEKIPFDSLKSYARDYKISHILE